jgi:hypothetical protein
MGATFRTNLFLYLQWMKSRPGVKIFCSQKPLGTTASTPRVSTLGTIDSETTHWSILGESTYFSFAYNYMLRFMIFFIELCYQLKWTIHASSWQAILDRLGFDSNES